MVYFKLDLVRVEPSYTAKVYFEPKSYFWEHGAGRELNLTSTSLYLVPEIFSQLAAQVPLESNTSSTLGLGERDDGRHSFEARKRL